MMLHGLGCREPWDMDDQSAAVYQTYGKLHLALRPIFERYGQEAAQGGAPMMRMMPLAFPEVDWSAVNDWDQQYMLGDDILVAPVAFYGNTRAIYLPQGEWFDVLTGEFVSGSAWRIHDVPLDRMPIFIRKGAQLTLASDIAARRAVQLVFDDAEDAMRPAPEEGWSIDAVGVVGGSTESQATPAMAEAVEKWFGTGFAWVRPVDAAGSST